MTFWNFINLFTKQENSDSLFKRRKITKTRQALYIPVEMNCFLYSSLVSFETDIKVQKFMIYTQIIHDMKGR